MAILEVRGLEKIYGRRKVVNGVSFDVDVGEVVGLLGPNGAGKTTSFRMATGQVTPNVGEVTFAGQVVTQLPMYRRARLGMGYLAQDTSVFRKLTVEQNILAVLEAMPRHRRLGRALKRRERYEMCDKVLEQFGLSRLRKNNAHRLSGGEKRRLEIARCLVCDPLLILLDEPFTGIDPHTIEDIQQIIRQLRNQGIGILITDHRVREILEVTDRTYLIKSGEVFRHGTTPELVNDQAAIEAYLGNSFRDNFRDKEYSTWPGGLGAPAPGASAQTTPTTPVGTSGTLGSSEPRMSETKTNRGMGRLGSEVAQGPINLRTWVEQDRVYSQLERLRTPEYQAASAELLGYGQSALAPLVEALEWRDPEMRRRAFEVLKQLWDGAVLFDPFAPDALRRQQVSELRGQITRRAG